MINQDENQNLFALEQSNGQASPSKVKKSKGIQPKGGFQKLSPSAQAVEELAMNRPMFEGPPDENLNQQFPFQSSDKGNEDASDTVAVDVENTRADRQITHNQENVHIRINQNAEEKEVNSQIEQKLNRDQKHISTLQFVGREQESSEQTGKFGSKAFCTQEDFKQQAAQEVVGLGPLPSLTIFDKQKSMKNENHDIEKYFSSDNSPTPTHQTFEMTSISADLSKPKHVLLQFDDTNINQLMAQEKTSGCFAEVWAGIRFVTAVYSFVTAWYFLGVAGFPSNVWLLLEISAEAIMLIDFFVVIYLKLRMPDQWGSMWLLQAETLKRPILMTLVQLAACYPYSFMFYLIYRNDPDKQQKLQQFYIAVLRMFKILHGRWLTKFFETKTIEYDSDKSRWHPNLAKLYALFIISLSTHVIACCWLTTTRIDPNRINYLVMARYILPDGVPDLYGFNLNYRPPRPGEIYVDACVYVIASMTGLGWGNLVPSTNLEWFVDIMIFLTGSSLFVYFFGTVYIDVYNKGLPRLTNEIKLDQALNFGTQRDLPPKLRQKIKTYYQDMRLNFLKVEEQFTIIQQLPLTLQSELCLFINCDIVQNVKFFQLAKPSFILDLCRSLSPQIALRSDFIIETEQLARKMYFIKTGIVQILATDDRTVIAFQSQGCYFGEIGLLLTGKRSCSVKAVTDCMLMTIWKEDLERLIDIFPDQGKFLKAVGKQRLLTSTPEDLEGYEPFLFDVEEGQIVYLDEHQQNEGDIFQNKGNSKQIGNENPGKSILMKDLMEPIHLTQENLMAEAPEQSEKLEKSDKKIVQAIREVTASFTAYQPQVYQARQTTLEKFVFAIKRFLFRGSQNDEFIPWNLTEDFKETQMKNFLIIPFSRLYNLWLAMMTLTTMYFVFMVPFQIGLYWDITSNNPKTLTLDIILQVTMVLDVFVRSRTAFVIDENEKVEFVVDIDKIQYYYINNMLIYDILAAIPLDYILLPFTGQDPVEFYGWVPRYVRLLKLFKFIRCFETLALIDQKSRFAASYIITFCGYLCTFIFGAHYICCSYLWIAEYEWAQRQNGTPTRFDGKCIYFEWHNRLWWDYQPGYQGVQNITILPQGGDYTRNEKYAQLLYLGTGLMAAVIYGDFIPLGHYEQIFTFFTMCGGRLFLAFLFAESSNYMARIDMAERLHTGRLLRIKEWSFANHLPTQLTKRIVNYYELLWSNFRGVKQSDIIDNLPKTLQRGIKQHILKDIVQNWLISLGITDKGVLVSLVYGIEINIIPGNEYIFKCGELAKHLYFIIKGSVQVVSDEGIILAVLGKGQHFGEQALINKDRARTATIRSMTDISVAVLDNSHFQLICSVYPFFKKRIEEVADQRAEQNRQTLTLVQRYTKQINNRHLPEVQEQDEEEEGEERPNYARIAPVQGEQAQEDSSATFGDHIAREFVKNNVDSSQAKKPSAAVNQYFQTNYKENHLSESKKKMVFTGKAKFFVRHFILLLIVYNIVWIPWQFAFHTKFEGIHLALEIFTIILYTLDIFFRIKNLRKMRVVNKNEEGEQRIFDSHGPNVFEMDTQELFNERSYYLKWELATTVIAVVPISLIFDCIDFYPPDKTSVYFHMVFCSLRLAKVLPLRKFFNQVRNKNMAYWRMFEMQVIYYIVNHCLACIWIALGLHLDYLKGDVRNGWLRRVPVTQMLGMRQSPVMDDISNQSIYVHALYFLTNTISHVGVGDMTSVNFHERYFNVLLMFVGTFTYCYLFGNIVGILGDFYPAQKVNFFAKYQYVKHRIGAIRKNQDLRRQIDEYFDYIWEDESNQIEDQFLDDLPQCIRYDIQLCKYQEAIEKSLIFKDDTGAIDVSLTNSIEKLMEVRHFMTNEFIFKSGQTVDEVLIILEGEAVMIGGFDKFIIDPTTGKPAMHESQFIGLMKVGSHYSNETGQKSYNYNNKAICHLLARQPTAIGFLSQENIQSLYTCFPNFKSKLQLLNVQILGWCEKSIDESAPQNPPNFTVLGPQQERRLSQIENHLTYSDSKTYKRIIKGIDSLKLIGEEQKKAFSKLDLLMAMKIYYYGQDGKYFPIYDQTYQDALKLNNMTTESEKMINLGEEEQDHWIMESLARLSSKCYVKYNSPSLKVFEFIQFLNCLWILCMQPMYPMFSLEMSPGLMAAESISTIISFLWVLLNFRTTVLVKGVPTLKIQTVYRHYRFNGFYYDIFGCIPLQLFLKDVSLRGHDRPFIWVITILRLIRMPSMWRGVQLFGKAEVIYCNNPYILCLKTALYTFAISHILSCQWWWVVDSLQQNYDYTWAIQMGLYNENITIWEKYLRSQYNIQDIVNTVGYGDMWPQTDPERWFFNYMISYADLTYAMCFGLIINSFLQLMKIDESRQFQEKISNMQEFTSKLDPAQQQRVQNYFAYEFQQNYNNFMLTYNSLANYLPHGIRAEMLYQIYKDLLKGMFEEYKSENLLKELACKLESKIYLPGDYIIYRGEIGQEMYFIAEGSVLITTQTQNKKVLKRLEKGDHFGETAIIEEHRRQESVQAETFCIIISLKQADFHLVAKNYPSIEEKLMKKIMLLRTRVDSFESSIYSANFGLVGKLKLDLISQTPDKVIQEHSQEHASSSLSSPLSSERQRQQDLSIQDETQSMIPNERSTNSLQRDMTSKRLVLGKPQGQLKRERRQSVQKQLIPQLQKYDQIMENKVSNYLSKTVEYENLREIKELGEAEIMEKKSVGHSPSHATLTNNDESKKINLEQVFRGVQNQMIYHSIRRMPRFNNVYAGPKLQVQDDNQVNNQGRRLSRKKLGKTLQLSQTTGLKLQWTVGNI